MSSYVKHCLYKVQFSLVNSTLKIIDPRIRIKSLLSYSIVIACFSFVSWQAIQCLIKYLDKPQATKFYLDYTYNNPFPAITICPNPKYDNIKYDNRFNPIDLHFCNVG